MSTCLMPSTDSASTMAFAPAGGEPIPVSSVKRSPNYQHLASVALAAQQIDDFVEYPPDQKPASFNLDAVLAQIQDANGGGHH